MRGFQCTSCKENEKELERERELDREIEKAKEREREEEREETKTRMITFGIYTGKTYYDLSQDLSYSNWILEQENFTDKRLVAFLRTQRMIRKLKAT